MSKHQVRASSRRVKLYRDQLIDNSLIIDDAQNDFLGILSLIFDNAREAKDSNSSSSPCNQPSHEDSSPNSENIEPENNKDNISVETQSFETANSVSLKKEYRKLYREVIKKVHPDRHDVLGIESDYQIKRSKKLFQNAKSCAELNNEQGIVELCAQLEVSLETVDPNETIAYLKDSETQLGDRIKAQEKSLQMMWHYNKDSLENKAKILKAYIEQTGKRGKNITDTLIKDVITSYNLDGTRKKRKVGQRPARLKR